MSRGDRAEAAQAASATRASEQLKSFIERIEALLEDKQAIADDVKEVFSEAKSCGFDTRAMRAILKMRKEDPTEREAFETVLETYMQALGMLG